MTPEIARRRIDVATLGLLLTLLLNFSALIWGAAKLTAAVDGLEATTERLGTAVERVTDVALDLDKRVTVIEDRQGRDD